MKTLDGAADEYVLNSCLSQNWGGKAAFKSGFNFASQWYAFDEDLPEHGVKVLIKDIHNEPISFRFTGSCNIKESAKLMGFTHWQPIRL